MPTLPNSQITFQKLKMEKERVRFATLDKKVKKEAVPLTEPNLRKHVEYICRHHPLSSMQRVLKWIQNVPENCDDPHTIDIKRSNTAPLLLDTSNLPRLDEPLFKPLKRSLTSHRPERGRLLCCLKIEVKTGVYKMLPVHEKDDPMDLATTFCQAQHLMGSLHPLKEHIQNSIEQYR
ncbi:hypothetical protein EDD86DRAFT_199396 [Gorgonomyces haynaldii]|nr:hypothetical protein EDD86DRAFT_199396 [Gorgonomyces haynaldii]